MTSKEEIFEKIQHVLTETFEIDAADITLETHLFDELDFDSFDAVDLAVTLEVETGIKLKEDDLRQIRTIVDIVDTIHTKMHEASNIEH